MTSASQASLSPIPESIWTRTKSVHTATPAHLAAETFGKAQAPRPAHAGEEQPQTERGHVDGDEVGGNELAGEHGMGRSQLERSERHREKNEAENENARLREHETRAPHGLCEQVGDAAALDVTDHEPAGEHRHENEGEHHEQKAVQVVDDEL